MAPPVPRMTLDRAPLKKAPGPSSLRILPQQCRVFLYRMSARPDCIIMRRRTVSKGYEMMPEAVVTVWAMSHDCHTGAFLGSLRRTPLAVSKPPKKAARYTMMPMTDTPKPWYRPLRPSDLKIFIRQSPRPVNWRSVPLPTSAPRRVRAKSRGYTNSSEVAPAAPPEARLPAKKRQKSLRSTPFRNICLYLSLKAKLSACVGK
mmetsp:Transcript_9209/g.15263  ORF Transcript_9209/g.15263 Transcript_9209/m.15263 type:complete len:203 (+) Transcript_9209:111-719(+)